MFCTASISNSREGELITLLGRNGAGRTTTLRAIMGMVDRRTGSIRIRGEEFIDKRRPPHRAAWPHRLLPGRARHLRAA